MKSFISAIGRRVVRFFGPPAYLLFLVLLSGSNVQLSAQPVLDGFDPNADGIVRTVAVQPDGKVLVGGIFTSVAPNGGPSVSRNRIARFNPDGTLDAAFNPNANSDVYAIAVQPDGKILVGGYFTTIGGTNRNRIARLDAVTGLADAFNPGVNEVVRTIVLEAGGSMLVGGDFSNIGGTNRSRIARLDSNGVVDLSFDPNASSFSSVYGIVPDSAGMLLVGGTFTSIGGQFRNRAARLNPSTGLADGWNPDVDSDVLSIAVQADGRIVLGGFFTSVGGQPRSNIARVDSTNGVPDAFDPGANATVQSVVVQADGKILAGGGFTFIGGQPRGRFARLDPTTGLADSFNPNAGGFISAIRVQAEGKILAVGGFTTMSTQPRGRIARFAIPQPWLDIQRDGETHVVLSWPTNFSSFILEANTNLSLNTWGTVSPAPTVSGTNNVVTNVTSGAERYYRLRQ
jgi:uncharacterized delta-60 repeat protein